jgi:hypothetical protein
MIARCGLGLSSSSARMGDRAKEDRNTVTAMKMRLNVYLPEKFEYTAGRSREVYKRIFHPDGVCIPCPGVTDRNLNSTSVGSLGTLPTEREGN